MDFFDVSEKVVVITGASGALGGEYAQILLKANAKVVCLDISVSENISYLEKKYPNSFIFCSTDITSKESITESLKKTIESFGYPNVLINNAALDSPPSAPPEDTGSFENYPESSWDKVLSVNLKGIFLTCQVYGSEMARHSQGSIINVSSIYGSVSPDQSLYQYLRDEGNEFYKPISYSASKSGIYNLTRYLATYWAKQGVRVNTLTLAGVLDDQDQRFLDAYCKRIPIGRMANLDEYNGAILFLSSSASSYMTGSNLVIDGGWTAI